MAWLLWTRFLILGAMVALGLALAWAAATDRG